MPIEAAAMHNVLTIQTYVNGQWHDALDLSFSDTQKVAGTRQSNALPVNDLDRHLGYWELQ
jgi:hypothetical protein